MMAALGSDSLPSLTLTISRRLSWTRVHVPSLLHSQKYHQTVPQGGKSCGRWRHGHPVLIRYRIALTISRISTVRCLPPCFSSGIRGSSMRHCSSVRSDGYCLRPLNQTSLHVPQCYQISYHDREVRLHGKLSIHPLSGLGNFAVLEACRQQ